MADMGYAFIVELAHAFGSHPLKLAIWSEGSCALKHAEGRFLVTRAGANLARLTETDIVEVDLAAACTLLNNEQLPDEGYASAVVAPAGAEPSTDTLIYAHLFDMGGPKAAAHTQPVEINQIISSPRARQFADRRTTAEEVISCGSSSVLVPFVDPGLALAKEVKRKVMLWRDRFKAVPTLLLLQNHGMIVLAGEIEEMVKATEMTVKCARVFIGSATIGGPMFLSPNHVAYLDALEAL
jgi:rhamnose utilization protein RhaD (predicted bifunctional aldolase and dehydrogenase)